MTLAIILLLLAWASFGGVIIPIPHDTKISDRQLAIINGLLYALGVLCASAAGTLVVLLNWNKIR